MENLSCTKISIYQLWTSMFRIGYDSSCVASSSIVFNIFGHFFHMKDLWPPMSFYLGDLTKVLNTLSPVPTLKSAYYCKNWKRLTGLLSFAVVWGWEAILCCLFYWYWNASRAISWATNKERPIWALPLSHCLTHWHSVLFFWWHVGLPQGLRLHWVGGDPLSEGLWPASLMGHYIL